MNCQEVMNDMQRQLDNDLDESELLALLDHTRQCPDCAAMFERLKQLSAELTSLPKVVPAYSLVDAILPELERIDLLKQKDSASAPASDISSDAPATAQRHSAAREDRSRRVQRERRWPSWRALSATVAVGIVASIFIITYPPNLSTDNNKNEAMTAGNSASLSMKSGMQAADTNRSMPSADEYKVNEVGTESYKSDAAEYEPLHELRESANIDNPYKVESTEELQFTGTLGLQDGTGQSNDADSGSPAVRDQYGDAITDKDEEELGIAASPDQRLGDTEFGEAYVSNSPDGAYQAVVDGYSIKISTLPDGNLIAETARKNGMHTIVTWSEDSGKLYYEVQLEHGAIQRYELDIASKRDEKSSQ